jgi:ACS family tartrate transporter-like MFS transporter
VPAALIGFAALQMNRGLHFSASIYGFGAGLFSIGYALFEIPSNLVLYRFGARRWIARILLTWGLIAMGMMFVRTHSQFYAMRFALGVAEAGFFPGVVFYMLQWFPDNLRARAISRFYVAAPLVAIANGLLAGPLMSLQGKLGLRGWQWLFLLEGLPAVLLSVLFLFQLPNTPDEAGWLLGLLSFCLLTCIYAYNLTAPIILRGVTGFSIVSLGVLMAINGLLGVVSMTVNATHSDHTRVLLRSMRATPKPKPNKGSSRQAIFFCVDLPRSAFAGGSARADARSRGSAILPSFRQLQMFGKLQLTYHRYYLPCLTFSIITKT